MNKYKLATGVLGTIVVSMLAYKVLAYVDGPTLWGLLLLTVCVITVPLSIMADALADCSSKKNYRRKGKTIIK